MQIRDYSIPFVALAIFTTSACNSETPPLEVLKTASSSKLTIPSNKSLLRIKMHDHSVDADALSQVILDLNEVQFIDSTGAVFVVSNSHTEVNLLKFSNDATLEIGHAILPAGNYSQIRLILGDRNRVISQGVEHELKVPSGTQTGIKMHAIDGHFELRGGRITHIMTDFAAQSSLNFTQGQGWILKPNTRITSIASLTVDQELVLQQLAGSAGGDGMLEEADMVIQGQTQSIEPFEGTFLSAPMIFTNVTVAVADTIKGEAKSTVNLEVIGGRIDDVAVIFSHVTYFTPAEKYLLFLKNYSNGIAAIGTNGGKLPIQ